MWTCPILQPDILCTWQVSNRTLEVLSAGSEDAAMQLSAELQEMREFLEEVSLSDWSSSCSGMFGRLSQHSFCQWSQLPWPESVSYIIWENEDHSTVYVQTSDRILIRVLPTSCPSQENVKGKSGMQEAKLAMITLRLYVGRWQRFQSFPQSFARDVGSQSTERDQVFGWTLCSSNRPDFEPGKNCAPLQFMLKVLLAHARL